MPVFAYSSLARGFFSGAFRSDNPEKAREILDEPGYIGYFCENNLKRLARCEELAEKKDITVAQAKRDCDKMFLRDVVCRSWCLRRPGWFSFCHGPFVISGQSTIIEITGIIAHDKNIGV